MSSLIIVVVALVLLTVATLGIVLNRMYRNPDMVFRFMVGAKEGSHGGLHIGAGHSNQFRRLVLYLYRPGKRYIAISLLTVHEIVLGNGTETKLSMCKIPLFVYHNTTAKVGWVNAYTDKKQKLAFKKQFSELLDRMDATIARYR